VATERRILAVAIAITLAIVAAVALSILLAADDEAPEPRFLPSRGDDPAVVWAVGDGANGSDEARQVAERIRADGADLLLYLGDVYEDGTEEEFDENYDSVYGQLARITGPTPGNHDWPNHDKGYDRYWKAVRDREVPSWYASRIAGWELISLNSEDFHDDGSAQVEWLRSEVRGPGTCRLAFWHRPRYSVGKHDDQPDIQPFWDALQGRATLILNGHEHNMQRYVPIAGMTEIVSGAGGHSHYQLDADEPRHAFANDTDYGALRLELRPGSVSFEFMTGDGRVLDSGRVRCRTGAEGASRA
jgi:3',5'-cyclic AMP phosphodiesterase CpdA